MINRKLPKFTFKSYYAGYDYHLNVEHNHSHNVHGYLTFKSKPTKRVLRQSKKLLKRNILEALDVTNYKL